MIIEGPANINVPARPQPITGYTKFDALPVATPTTVPERSGNTQTQVTLMGARGTKNGGIETMPVGVAPDGSILMTMETEGFSGVYAPEDGDHQSFGNGLFLGATRGGAAPPPIPSPPQPR